MVDVAKDEHRQVIDNERRHQEDQIALVEELDHVLINDAKAHAKGNILHYSFEVSCNRLIQDDANGWIEIHQVFLANELTYHTEGFLGDSYFEVEPIVSYVNVEGKIETTEGLEANRSFTNEIAKERAAFSNKAWRFMEVV